MAYVESNGCSLYYKESGSGEPLLLVTGTGFNADVWDKTTEKFSSKFRTIVYDRRSYSRSKCPLPSAEDYNHLNWEDIISLLKALDAEPAHIVGWSMGCIYALNAARIHPECVKSLILYEPAIFLRDSFDLSVVMSFVKMGIAKSFGNKKKALEIFMRLVTAYPDKKNSYDGLSPEFKSAMLNDIDVFFTEMDAGEGKELTPETLKSIKIPVALLVGERSHAVSRNAVYKLAQLMNDAPVLNITGSNHASHLDQPDIFVKTVNEAIFKITSR